MSGVREELGRFGHHPDPAIDFEVEVESLIGRMFNAQHGIAKPGETAETVDQVMARVDNALRFNVGADESAVRAKGQLRALATAIPESGEAVDLSHALGKVRARANAPGTLATHGPQFVAGMRKAANMLDSMKITKSVFYASPPAKPAACETCNGHGEIGGNLGQTAESFGYESQPCPDCAKPAADDMRAVDGADRFFMYDGDNGNFDTFDTIEQAIASGKECLQDCGDEGWPDGGPTIYYGAILGEAVEVPGSRRERGPDDRPDFDVIVNYELTPAPTAPALVVDDAMVGRYVEAVNHHLASLTPKDWEIERFDPVASVYKVARVGLTAAMSTIQREGES